MGQIDPAWEVSVQDVKRMLDAKQAFLLVDVRQPEEYRIASIDGAQLIPLPELPARIDEVIDARRPVIVHCHHGGRSLQAAQFLRQHGLADVRSMAGGIDAWAIEIDPSQRRY